MAENPQIAEALLQVAREIHAQRDLASTMEAIVQSARRSLSGVDHVGVSLVHRGGGIETVAGTDPLVWELDSLQYELGEGPCLDAIQAGPLTVANHLRHDPRWRRYVPCAVERGVTAQMGVRLYVETETLGGLNLYSTSTEVIDPELQDLAKLFAAHATLALGKARQEEDLNAALATRKVIGQALGMLMERYQLDEDRAFQFLVRVSQASNVKLRDIAQELVDQRNTDAIGAPVGDLAGPAKAGGWRAPSRAPQDGDGHPDRSGSGARR
jgi:transcriptional regulator with GAF, ATPase, and Fis domain